MREIWGDKITWAISITIGYIAIELTSHEVIAIAGGVGAFFGSIFLKIFLMKKAGKWPSERDKANEDTRKTDL